jgi:hypothetical protein
LGEVLRRCRNDLLVRFQHSLRSVRTSISVSLRYCCNHWAVFQPSALMAAIDIVQPRTCSTGPQCVNYGFLNTSSISESYSR